MSVHRSRTQRVRLVEIEYRILGPLEVHAGGEPVRIGAPRQRAVLAALLLAGNRVVSVERLVEQLWGESPPARARNTVQSLVLRLRRLLPRSDVLVTRPPGYLLRVAPGQVDLDRFHELLARGRTARAAGEPVAAAAALRDALGLWRGEPLDNVSGPGLRLVEAPRLGELRLQAVEERIEADLLLGRHDDLVTEILALVGEHPLRERLYGQLMTALYRAGRQAEALALFHTLRHRLVDELAIEPGASLQKLYQQILTHDPALDLVSIQYPPVAVPAPRRPSRTIPAQLPPDLPGFVGRDGDLAHIDTVAGRTTRSSTVVISVLSGSAGVGKTTLAVRAAHRLKERFPDGQLYVNLRGFDPAGPPMTPAEAVRGFLDAFDVPAASIPPSLPAQVGRYRDLVAGLRVLVLLDNARDAEQVRPLLPGAPGCLVLVTSRDRLTGLVTAEGADPVTLDLLSAAASRQLLAERLGTDRLAAEPAAVDQIVARCAGLPLALAVVAARAATHPGFPLAALAKELAEAGTGLDAFAGADIRAVFSCSYGIVSGSAARLFRLLSQHPGPDVGSLAAASLTGVPPRQVRPLLAELCRAHLIAERDPGRYSFHDLLRAYASDLAESTPEDAMPRLFDHYLHAAYAADRLLDPYRDAITPIPPGAAVTVERPTDYQQAYAWFSTELPVLLALVRRAADAGFDAHAWQLAWCLGVYLDRRGHWQDWVGAQQVGLAAAERLGDRTGQAHAHRLLTRCLAQLGNYQDAYLHHQRASELFRDLGDHLGQAHTNLSLGWLRETQGHLPEALRANQEALELFQVVGDRCGQARALNNIGWFHAELGRPRQAIAYCERALALLQQLGELPGAAATWDSLGYAHDQLGDHRQAITCYQRALELFQQVSSSYLQSGTLVRLGEAYRAVGDPESARRAWRQAVDILDDIGHPDADRVREMLAETPNPSGGAVR